MHLETKNQFIERYGESDAPLYMFFAPGRVNLIGEHTDYNGGFVFPCALTFGTYLAVRKNNTSLFRFSSGNMTESFDILIDSEFKNIAGAWLNYPLGVISQFQQRGHNFEGMDMHFLGNIPSGAGLSSSASIEMVTAVALNSLYSLEIKAEDLAKLCQKAENEFVGVNCGIMDQFASAMGKANHAIFLNCKTLNYVEVPLHLDEYAIVIVNTNKKRELVDSKYNERRAECEQALKELQEYKRWRFLGEIPIEDFEKAEHHIVDDTIAKRAYHVITEDKRVLEAAKALHRGDLYFFGKLMIASHESLKTLYEVSCLELDVLVEEALNIPGVIGARMTGGGFGGCTVNLMKKEVVNQFIEEVGTKYKERTSLKADFYLPDIGDGAREIKEV